MNSEFPAGLEVAKASASEDKFNLFILRAALLERLKNSI
jgi:hypothetical protein